jgi:hypothetical protein
MPLPAPVTKATLGAKLPFDSAIVCSSSLVIARLWSTSGSWAEESLDRLTLIHCLVILGGLVEE